MTELTISLEENGSKGRYYARPDTVGPEAELTFSRTSDSLIIIDHTGVPDALRNTGIGVALVARAVEDARHGGYRILPLCPFAAAQFRRNPDWADVLSR